MNRLVRIARLMAQEPSAFRNAESPKEMMILDGYEDREKARQMFWPQEFPDAGVSGTPEVTFLDEIMTLVA